MAIKPLEILDLPTLHRYRTDAAQLDVTQCITRGNPLTAINYLDHLNPVKHIYTAVAHNENQTDLIGSITQKECEPFAHLLYLAPESQLQPQPLLAELIEHLIAQAGKWGAYHLVAEVDEDSPTCNALRKNGFAVYAWQRIWDLSHLSTQADVTGHWKVMATHQDVFPVQHLFHQIVPALLQSIEALCHKPGDLFCAEDNLEAYAQVTIGTQATLIRPFIHPETKDVADKLIALPKKLGERRKQTLYICVRSYQAWLELILEDLGARAGARQAVMVKHLTHAVRETKNVLNGTQPTNISVQPTGIARFRKKHENNSSM